MDSKVTIAGLLVSISAYAKKNGLQDLDARVSDAAMAALLEIPGDVDVPELSRLAAAATARPHALPLGLRSAVVR